MLSPEEESARQAFFVATNGLGRGGGGGGGGGAKNFFWCEVMFHLIF